MKSLLKSLFLKGLIQFGISTSFKAKAPRYLLFKFIAGLLLLLGGVFFLIALHEILSLYYSLQVTNLIFAAIFFIAAITILVTVAFLKNRHQHQNPIRMPLRMAEELGSHAQEQIKKAASTADLVFQKHTKKIIVGVAVFALLIGRYSSSKK